MNAEGKNKKETNDISRLQEKHNKIKAVEVYKMYEDMVNEEVQELCDKDAEADEA